MIEKTLILTLITTALHVCSWDGMILHRPATKLAETLAKWRLSVLCKPLFECLTCMGGIYTLALYPLLFGIDWHVLPTMLCVIGLNTIVGTFLHWKE